MTTNDALYRLQAYCARAERCEQDVRRRLFFYGVPQAEAEDVVRKLKTDGFLNNARYCAAYVHDKMLFSKWGKRKIKNALMRKSIDPELIEQELGKYADDTQTDKLQQILETKLRQLMRTSRFKDLSLTDDTDDYTLRNLKYDLRTRLLRHAAAQGFDYETSLQTIESLIS